MPCGAVGACFGDQVDALRLASIAANAAMFAIRCTAELDVRVFTGALTPGRNYPTATWLPASVLSCLYAMFSASTLGHLPRQQRG